jgi:hypothetical protein
MAIYLNPSHLPTFSHCSIKLKASITNVKMQLTLLTPMLLLLTSIHALPKPDDATTSSDSTISSTDGTDHYPSQSQNPVVATVDLWKSGGCQPRICNHNFLVYLNGCSIVPKGCSTSAKITTGSDNCYCKSPSFPFGGH